jgi:hypothetical protein
MHTIDRSRDGSRDSSGCSFRVRMYSNRPRALNGKGQIPIEGETLVFDAISGPGGTGEKISSIPRPKYPML